MGKLLYVVGALFGLGAITNGQYFVGGVILVGSLLLLLPTTDKPQRRAR